MGSKATTVDEQIKKLIDRGLIMDLGTEKAKQILLDIGYYRFGFYRHPFEIDKKHNLKKGTKFSDILALYYLDVDLRNLLIKYLNRVETNFKTKLIYLTSNKYNNDNTWFVNNSIVSDDFIYGKRIKNKDGILTNERKYGFKDKIYTDYFKKNNLPIKKHHQNNKGCHYAPAWKTIEFLTFGQSFTIYKSLLNSSLKNDISIIYQIESTTKFENYIGTLVDLRNACAHCNVLFDYNAINAIASTPFLSIENSKKQSLGSCLKVLIYFIEKISTNRKNDFLSELEYTFDKIRKQFPDNIDTINYIIKNKMMILN